VQQQTRQRSGVLDLIREVADIATAAIGAVAASHARDAAVCGCPGCKTQAAQSVAWMLSILGTESLETAPTAV
jgi:hypothetical protein